MKISNSKKELAIIISENGGWRDGCDFVAQDKDSFVCFYEGKPTRCGDSWEDKGDCQYRCGLNQGGTIQNWHQTALSRDEYFHLYPAPDADGWIEWDGGECPVSDNSVVDVKFYNGGIGVGLSPLPCGGAGKECWRSINGRSEIIAYRLHKQEQAKPEFCEPMMGSIPEPEVKPTIEQLATDYRNAKDCAERKQQEADAAKADADANLAELVAAGKAIGLVLSVAGGDPELVITDWRDLQVGDEVEASYRGIERVVGTVLKIDVGDNNQPIFVSDGVRSIWATEFRFISRP